MCVCVCVYISLKVRERERERERENERNCVYVEDEEIDDTILSDELYDRLYILLFDDDLLFFLCLGTFSNG